MASPDIDELYKEFSTGVVPKTPDQDKSVNVDELYKEFSPTNSNLLVKKGSVPEPVQGQRAIQEGFGKGISDVAEFGASGVAAIDKAVLPGGEDRAKRFDEIIAEKNKEYEKEYGQNTVAKGARLGGQIAATAPLVPSRLLQATDAVMGAAPTITATGSKILAPAVNRFGATAVKGGIGGGVFNAATAKADHKDLVPNVEEGIIMGAVGAPVITSGSALAGKTIQSARNLWASVDIAKMANGSGLPASSVKKVIGHLENLGYTPQQAQAELNALGPKATLMDLDDALSSLGRGLTTMGEKPRSILSGRMQTRADTANSDTINQLEAKLGPRPQVYFERGKAKGKEIDDIVKAARLATSFDYSKAHGSKDVLPTQGIVSIIDSSLESAVGQKASSLKEIKGYLYNPNGQLKTNIKDLHEVRQGIDDILNKKGDSLSPNAYREVNNIRDVVDGLLKTNLEMASADAKFAKEMKRVEGIQYGYNVIAKGANRDEFAKLFNAATPEIQEAIKKGQYAAVREKLDQSSQGELTEANKLFGKKAVNRANFKTAFGKDADEVMDAIHKDMTFRETERRVMHGSDTAQNQAFQQEYGIREKAPGAFGEGAKSIGMDAIAGTYGVLSATRGISVGMKHKFAKWSEDKREQTIEGAADILSRSGKDANVAMGIAQRIKDRMDGSKKSNLLSVVRLPVTSSAPAGEEVYEKGEGTYKFGKKFFQQVFGK